MVGESKREGLMFRVYVWEFTLTEEEKGEGFLVTKCLKYENPMRY